MPRPGSRQLGVAEGVNVSWELPTWLESMVLVGALSRLGAVQNPMLPIYRAREVGFITRQTKARLLVVPSVWKGFDFEAMANEVAGEVDGLDVLVCDRSLPEGDPADAAAAAGHARRPCATCRCAGCSTRRAPPPTRRARSTPTAP